MEIAFVTDIREVRLEYEDLPASLQLAVDYWRVLKGDRIAPTWREVDMMKLPTQLLSTTVVVDCFNDQDGQPNFRYRYFGSGLRSIHNVELTGKTPDDVPVPELAKFIKSEFASVQESKRPVFAGYGTNLLEGAGDFLDVVRLPISEDGENITQIIGVISYKQHDLALNTMFANMNAGADS